MDADGHNLRCLTTTYPCSSYHKLTWLDPSNLLVVAYTPSVRYFILDIVAGAMRPFMPELNPQLITKVTANGTIIIPARDYYVMVPLHGTLNDRTTLSIAGSIVDVSSDGQWIAYTKEETPDYLYLQQRNTAHVQTILMFDPENDHVADNRTVVWSPNNRYLAYETDAVELWVMRADGTQRRYVGDLEYFWNHFRWSPDSTSLAYIGPVPVEQGGGPGVSEAPLYITAINAPNPRYLTTLRKSDGSGGAWDWMADSQHLVYATNTKDHAELYKMKIESSEQYLLTDPDLPFAAIYAVASFGV